MKGDIILRKEIRHKSLIIAMSILLIFAFNLTAFAQTNCEEPIKGNPPPGEGNPIGALNPFEGSSQMVPVSPDLVISGISPKAIAYYITWVDSITSTWDGFNWRGWKVSGGPGGTVSLSNSYTVSNGYSANITVADSGISAGVGFNVTYSTTMQASYSHVVNSGRYGWIGYDDWYHCKNYTCHTTFYDPWGIPQGTSYGNGYAKQWYMFGYQYGESSSYNIQPPDPH